jgi:hypothetical protein
MLLADEADEFFDGHLALLLTPPDGGQSGGSPTILAVRSIALICTTPQLHL